jgi:LPS O-antigen subunit length determinant protein (WzzB/FepE family)
MDLGLVVAIALGALIIAWALVKTFDKPPVQVSDTPKQPVPIVAPPETRAWERAEVKSTDAINLAKALDLEVDAQKDRIKTALAKLERIEAALKEAETTQKAFAENVSDVTADLAFIKGSIGPQKVYHYHLTPKRKAAPAAGQAPAGLVKKIKGQLKELEK